MLINLPPPHWGAEAGAPSGNGIARVNGQALAVAVAVAAAAAAVMAVVEEEEEQGAVDCDGNHAANSNRGPITHGDHPGG
jgi:hypothetical protein